MNRKPILYRPVPHRTTWVSVKVRAFLGSIRERSKLGGVDGGEGGIIPNAICGWDALGCAFSIPQPIASQGFILNPLKPLINKAFAATPKSRKYAKVVARR
jgi:hypothetical protein